MVILREARTLPITRLPEEWEKEERASVRVEAESWTNRSDAPSPAELLRKSESAIYKAL